MAKAKSGHVDVDKLRQCLLDLSAMQIELRRRLKEYLEASSDTFNATARKADIKWSGLKNFSEGRSCLSGGRGLKGLAQLLGCEELGNEISALSSQIGDRYLVLASCSPSVINLALDLVKAYQERADRYTSIEFAGSFEDHSQTILGVLNCSQQALEALEDDEVFELISIMLIADLDERLEKSKEAEDAKRQGAAVRLRELAEPLIMRLGGRGKLAEAMGSPPNSFYMAMNGKASLEQTQRLIAKAEKLSRAKPPAQSEPAPNAVVSVMPESSLPVSSVLEVVAALGGVTTDEGVSHVLTEASFRALEKVPLIALRECLLKVLPMARLLLNIGSQFDDPTGRKILQESIGHELEELELAIRIFTFTHPNQLLPLYDNQREVWAKSRKPSNSPTRKGRP